MNKLHIGQLVFDRQTILIGWIGCIFEHETTIKYVTVEVADDVYYGYLERELTPIKDLLRFLPWSLVKDCIKLGEKLPRVR